MDRQGIKVQVDQIEQALRDHPAPGCVTGGHVTPQWIQFRLKPAPGIKAKRIESLSRKIATALGAPTIYYRWRGVNCS